MKKFVFVSAILLALAACSSDDHNDGYSCSVNRTDKSVAYAVKYRDFEGSETVTAYLNGQGSDSLFYIRKSTYPNVSAANEECEAMKHEYYDYVECYGKTVEVGERAEEESLDYYKDYYEERCAKYDKAYKNGELEKSYDKTFN